MAISMKPTTLARRHETIQTLCEWSKQLEIVWKRLLS